MTPVRRVLLVGHGRMARLVEQMCPEYGFEVSGVLGRQGLTRGAMEGDVAIDFSVAEAVAANAGRLASARIPIVIGTTGWQADEPQVRAAVERHGTAVVAAPNFALGVNIFLALAERAGALLAARPEFGAWIHELHHAAKRDAPSGTALALHRSLQAARYELPVDIASTRAGAIPGTHTVGFDAAAETITLTHTARDRSAFARGALEAARWLEGRRGWYTMRDVLGL